LKQVEPIIRAELKLEPIIRADFKLISILCLLYKKGALSYHIECEKKSKCVSVCVCKMVYVLGEQALNDE